MVEVEKMEKCIIETEWYRVEVPKKVKEVVDKLLERDFEVWNITENKIIMGKVTFEDGYGELQDWIKVIIDRETGKGIVKYGTNREIPGWDLCPACGSWYNYENEDEEERHSNCEFMTVEEFLRN